MPCEKGAEFVCFVGCVHIIYKIIIISINVERENKVLMFYITSVRRIFSNVSRKIIQQLCNDCGMKGEGKFSILMFLIMNSSVSCLQGN